MPQFTCVIDDKFIKFGAKVTMTYNIEDLMKRIKENLTDSQKKMFSKTYYGAFLNITKFTPSPQILHNLMCRIVNVPDNRSDEMYFEICGKLLCYSLHHFAMITGLTCEGYVNYKYAMTSERSEFVKSYFKQLARFKRETSESWFLDARLNNDEDVVNLALVYHINSLLLNNNPTVVLLEFFVNLVDNVENFTE